jgi:hypothetical protein
MYRRDLLKSVLASSAGALALTSAGVADASSELESMAAELTKDLYANDGLVLHAASAVAQRMVRD